MSLVSRVVRVHPAGRFKKRKDRHQQQAPRAVFSCSSRICARAAFYSIKSGARPASDDAIHEPHPQANTAGDDWPIMQLFMDSPTHTANMTHRQYVILAGLVAIMALTAYSLGQWSVSLNPEGIIPHTPATQATAEAPAEAIVDSAVEPRSAFTFGASMGLLGVGLVYGMLAAIFFLRAKTGGKPVGPLIYGIAGLAAAGFALSYIVDDYFY